MTRSRSSPLQAWLGTNWHQNKGCFPVSFFEFLCFYLFHCTRLYTVLPNTVIAVTKGPPSLGTHVFQRGLGSFLLKAHRSGSGSELRTVCALNCWLTGKAVRRPSPAFCLWSWMKLACGKAKHCRLRCVFLTWNQLALHKYRGFLSQQRSGAGRAVRPKSVRHLCSCTSSPSGWHLERRVYLPKSFLTSAFSPLLLLYVFLSLAWFKALDVDVAVLPSAAVPPNARPGSAVCVGRSSAAGGAWWCLGRQIITTGKRMPFFGVAVVAQWRLDCSSISQIGSWFCCWWWWGRMWGVL